MTRALIVNVGKDAVGEEEVEGKEEAEAEAVGGEVRLPVKVTAPFHEVTC